MRGLVALGRLRPGSPVPSVRELAKELRVNPATVARAYQKLADDGFFTVARGEGTFVAPEPPTLKTPERSRALGEAAARFARTASALGARRDEAATQLSAAFDLLDRERTEGPR
jgi:GntR family transcriptional regulator